MIDGVFFERAFSPSDYFERRSEVLGRRYILIIVLEESKRG
jgi:hypothetical protein